MEAESAEGYAGFFISPGKLKRCYLTDSCLTVLSYLYNKDAGAEFQRSNVQKEHFGVRDALPGSSGKGVGYY